MATETAAGNIAATIRVDKSVSVPAGYGTADGWLFSLPAGLQNNNLFDMVGDEVRFKAQYYPCKKYRIVVKMERAGWLTKQQTFEINVRDQGALIAAGSNFNIGALGDYSSPPTSGQVKRLRFNYYLDTTATDQCKMYLFSNGIEAAGSSYVWIWNSGNTPVLQFIRHQSGGISAWAGSEVITTSRWVSVEIIETDAGVTSIYFDGIYSGSPGAYSLRMDLSSNCYFGRFAANSGGKMVVANLYFEKDGVVIIAEECTTLPNGAVIAGTVTFNELGDAS